LLRDEVVDERAGAQVAGGAEFETHGEDVMAFGAKAEVVFK
jgi:hypothetical protein